MIKLYHFRRDDRCGDMFGRIDRDMINSRVYDRDVWSVECIGLLYLYINSLLFLGKKKKTKNDTETKYTMWMNYS